MDEARTHSDWAKYMKKLIDNPNFAYDLGQRLYETVKDTYDLNKVTFTGASDLKSKVIIPNTHNKGIYQFSKNLKLSSSISSSSFNFYSTFSF